MTNLLRRSTFRCSIMLSLLFALTLSHSIRAQETIQNIDSALTVLKNAPRDTAKAILYQKLGGHYNVVHLDSARSFLEAGYKLADEIDYDRGRWMNLSTLGVYHERKTQYDSAMTYLNRALEIVKATNSTKGFAIVLNNIATVQIRKAEYQEALKNMFEALKAEETLGNRNGVAQAYNNIGVIYYYTGNFERTTHYLTLALEIQEELGNLDGLQNGYNNVGAIHEYQKEYDKAIESYTKALEISRRLKDTKQEASFLSNIALSYTNKGSYEVAERYFRESIDLKEKIEDYNGMAMGYISFGQLLLKQNKINQARNYLNEGVELAKKHRTRLSLREGYAALSELAEKENDYKAANKFLYEYIAVKDSILNEDNARILAETEAKYENEKKENEILAQRAQLAEKDLEVRQKNTLMYGGFALALILGLLGYLLFNQQKLKNRQLKKENELKTALARIETQNKLQEQRLRISRDLHDNIGSQLTFVTSSVDNLKFGLKDGDTPMSKKLARISEFTTQTIYELRDTIWAMNKNEITSEDLQTRIANFIEKAGMARDEIEFSFSVSEEISQHTIFTSLQGMNIYRIIQEAVNNSLKYAGASKIAVDLRKEDGKYKIEISDNGAGFDPKTSEAGHGLNNMKKRARDLGGEAVIISEEGKGTTVTVAFKQ